MARPRAVPVTAGDQDHEKALEQWRRLMDEKRTSAEAFLEHFPLQVKRARIVRGKLTSMQEFTLRHSQGRVHDLIDQEWKAGRGASIVVAKDRTQGLTTYFIRRFFERGCRAGGWRAKIISRKDDATAETFLILDSMVRQVPEWVWREVLHARLRKSSSKQFQLDFEDGSTTLIECVTSSDPGLGRGGAVNGIFIDEYAHWRRDKDVVDGLFDSWDDSPGNICAIVSTGNGREAFYERFRNARDGHGGSWVPFFCGWLEHPDKVRAFTSDAQRETFWKSVGLEDRYGRADEINLRDVHKATPEQLHWRRHAIDHKYRGKLLTFRVENPTTWRDAFLVAESTVYSHALIEARMDAGERMDRDAKKGAIILSSQAIEWGPPSEDDVPRFLEELGGRWFIYEPPEVGMVYTWGADVAEGLQVLADGKHEGDLSAVIVRNVFTESISALYFDWIEPTAFAREIAKGALYYGRCAGYVEANNHGHLVIARLNDMELGDVMLTRQRLERSSDTGKKWTQVEGFLSMRGAKQAAVDLAVEWFHGLGMPREGERPRVPAVLLNEMLRVQNDEKGWYIGADRGHDDLGSALYLSQAAIEVMKKQVDRQTPVQPRLTPNERYLLRMVADEATADQLEADRDLGGGF